MLENKIGEIFLEEGMNGYRKPLPQLGRGLNVFLHELRRVIRYINCIEVLNFALQ